MNNIYHPAGRHVLSISVVGNLFALSVSMIFALQRAGVIEPAFGDIASGDVELVLHFGQLPLLAAMFSTLLIGILIAIPALRGAIGDSMTAGSVALVLSWITLRLLGLIGPTFPTPSARSRDKA